MLHDARRPGHLRYGGYDIIPYDTYVPNVLRTVLSWYGMIRIILYMYRRYRMISCDIVQYAPNSICFYTLHVSNYTKGS